MREFRFLDRFRGLIIPIFIEKGPCRCRSGQIRGAGTRPAAEGEEAVAGRWEQGKSDRWRGNWQLIAERLQVPRVWSTLREKAIARTWKCCDCLGLLKHGECGWGTRIRT